MEKHMGGEPLITKLVTSMRDTGKTIRLTVKENSLTAMAQHTTDNGNLIISMERG